MSLKNQIKTLELKLIQVKLLEDVFLLVLVFQHNGFTHGRCFILGPIECSMGPGVAIVGVYGGDV